MQKTCNRNLNNMRQDVENFLKDTMKECNIPPLFPLYNLCEELLTELDSPMRIAITGMIKTGKSTLLNALLGKYIVPTAVEVLTYNVNWFHHVKNSPNGTEQIIVHFHNKEDKTYSLSDLNKFVAYGQNNKETLNAIHWVDVYLDEPILKIFDLIDTPGLSSLVGTESQHTRDLLTKDKNRPDAIVYLMKKGFKSSDVSEVSDFHSATGLMSGINTVAALTRVDELNGNYKDAEEIIKRNLSEHAEIRYFFSNIFPISALPAEASSNLSTKDIERIKKVSMTKSVDELTLDRSTFVCESSILSTEEAEGLCEKLSISGIRLLLNFFNEHPEASAEDCKKYLYDFSRVEELKTYLLKQFGTRADFHKTQRVIMDFNKFCRKITQSMVGDGRKKVISFLQQSNKIIEKMHDVYFPYFILSDYYNQLDYFDENNWEKAKRVLGEYGADLYSRLGIPKDSNENEISNEAIKVSKYWLNLSNTLDMMSNKKGSIKARKIYHYIKQEFKL